MAGINGISGIVGVAAVGASAQPGAAVRPQTAAPTAASPDSAAPPVPATSAADKRAQAVEVQQSASNVQQMLAKAAPNLTFTVDKESGRTLIKVIDPATGELLRQIPAEEILRMDKNLDKMIARLKGLLIDRQG